jgi:hypothetical protein
MDVSVGLGKRGTEEMTGRPAREVPRMTKSRRRTRGRSTAASTRKAAVEPVDRQFRYRTPAMHGRWWPTRRQAVREAVEAGQAVATAGRVRLLRGTRIEEQAKRIESCEPERVPEPDVRAAAPFRSAGPRPPADCS